jgi:hypothetical protein
VVVITLVFSTCDDSNNIDNDFGNTGKVIIEDNHDTQRWLWQR